jgi:NTP pyrophosphatase (non-canonical NTP hydrolase)
VNNEKQQFNWREALSGDTFARDGLYAAATRLTGYCNGLAEQAGWWIDTETGEDVRTWPTKFFKLWVSAKLMLVVTEVAEAMEGHRKGVADDKLPNRSMLEVELADTVIRVFDLAGGLGLDLAGAIVEKLTFNASRADHKIENRVKEGGKSI